MSSSNKIVVYSKNGCPNCDYAKDLLKDLNLPFEEVFLSTEDPTYAEQRDALVTRTNHKTFPQIFVGDVFVGGAMELQKAYDTLKLHELVEKIGLKIEMDF
jgi:glutaredoxin 3